MDRGKVGNCFVAELVLDFNLFHLCVGSSVANWLIQL